MQELTIYTNGNTSQELAVVDSVPLQKIDTAFLATWLHGKSEKTQGAYTGDIAKFYAHVRPKASSGQFLKV